MQRHRSEGADPWLAGPVLPTPDVMEQSWSDAVIVHWCIPVSAAASYMPSNVEPGVFDGSTWVGFIGFRRL